MFPIEDEIFSCGPQLRCDFSAKKDEGKNITVLRNDKRISTLFSFSEKMDSSLTFALHSLKIYWALDHKRGHFLQMEASEIQQVARYAS